MRNVVHPSLTPDQRARVRETLEALRHQTEPVALLFYGRLFELDPSARRLFHGDLGVQSRKIMDTLDSIARSLEQLDLLSERLADLGRKHASYGVRPDQYESVTNALMWAFAQALGPDFDRATREAWTLTLAHVCEAMQRGAPSLESP